MSTHLGRAPVLGADFDRTTGVLIFKIGQYPLHLGSLSVARSMGRVGVTVGGITESLRTPLSRSRYVVRSFVWPTYGTESDEELLRGLAGIGEQWIKRPVLVCTDDESAVFAAEHADALSEWYVLPDMPPELPRALADKQGLQCLCERHDVATAQACFPTTQVEVEKFAATALFPVMVKNARPWTRLQAPAVPVNTLVRTPDELFELALSWSEPISVSLQEYLPAESSEDWIFHGYVARDGSVDTAFTGVKLRSWPPHAGVTTYARSVKNQGLVAEAIRFLSEIGYRGPVDQDWRFDRRDGRYKLLDSNPRLGNQFLLFENQTGINVVRAMHLDLTGRPVPGGRQRTGVGLRVENLDFPAFALYRGHKSHQAISPTSLESGGGSTFGWWASDDPKPFLVAMAGSVPPGLGRLSHGARELWQRRWLRRSESVGTADSVVGVAPPASVNPATAMIKPSGPTSNEQGHQPGYQGLAGIA
jgi:predicted ATP-grasp superfamily ATP-dependent carboligase